MYNYRKHLAWSKLKVGVVITAALITLFLTVMFAGNISELISPKVPIFALFEDVRGLREDAPVWFSGIEIGAVKALSFDPGEKIRVTILVRPDALRYLRRDAEARILTLGLLGDKYVELSPGSEDAQTLRAGDTITGISQTELKDIVETSQESIARITDFVKMLEEVLVNIEKGEGTLSQFLKDPTIYNNLKDTTTRLSVVIRRLEEGKGTLGGLATDDGLYEDITSSVKDIRLFAASLRKSEGTVYKLIEDPGLYDRFTNALTSLNDVSVKLAVSRGTFHRLVEDESLYENINGAAERLNGLLERIDRGDGLAGSLVQDDALAEELKTTLAELKSLVTDMRENPTKYFKFSLF